MEGGDLRVSGASGLADLQPASAGIDACSVICTGELPASYLMHMYINMYVLDVRGIQCVVSEHPERG